MTSSRPASGRGRPQSASKVTGSLVMTAAQGEYEGPAASPVLPNWPAAQSPEQNAFGACEDFSKINATRHRDFRSETFKQSGTRKKTFNTVKFLDNHRGQPETRDLLMMIEAGFASSMRDLGLEIIADFREELHVSVSTLRKEVTDALEAHTGTKTKPANVTLVDIMQKVTEIQERNERPATIDWTTVRDEIRKTEAGRSEGHHDLTKLLERLQHQCEHGVLLQIREEIRAAQLGKDVEEVVLRGEAQFEKLIKEQQAVSAQVQRLQQAQLDKIETHLSDQKRDQGARAEEMFTAFTKAQGNRKEGFEDLHQEIVRVQQALNVEFAKEADEMAKIEQALNLEYDQEVDESGEVVPHRRRSITYDNSSDGATVLPPGHRLRRVREYYTQTDAPAIADGSSQTCHESEREKKKRRSTAAPSANRPFAHRVADELLRKENTEGGKINRNKVFADAEAMKQQARQALIKRQVHVSDFYRESGWSQRIARSWAFEHITFAVIALNALWIAVDTDHNDAHMIVHAEPVFIVVENIFCCYFTAEVIIRLRAFRKWRHVVHDPWFLFDAALVTLMIIETWVITLVMLAIGPTEGSASPVIDIWIVRMIRMVKMFRISRMARIMRAIPELVIIVKGIGAAARSVLVFFALWLIIIYVFAVVFRQLSSGFEDIEQRFFRSVPDAMNTLLLQGIMPENSLFVDTLGSRHYIFWPPIVFFIVLVSMILGYMLIGVLVEVIQSVASAEKEKLVVGHIAQDLRRVMEGMGYELDTTRFTRTQFRNLCVDGRIATTLQGFNVNVVVLVDMTDVIFDDLDPQSQGLTFEVFVDCVLNMRGTNPATVKDVKEQMRLMKEIMRETESKIAKSVESGFTKFRVEIQEVRQAINNMAEVAAAAVADGDSCSERDEFTRDSTTMAHNADDSVPLSRHLPPELHSPPDLPGGVLT